MDYLYQYFLFLAQAATVVVAVVAVIIAIAAATGRRQPPSQQGYLSIDKLNEEFDHQRDYLRSVLVEKDALKQLDKAEAKAEKARLKAGAKPSRAAPPAVAAGQDAAVAAGQDAAVAAGEDAAVAALPAPLPGRARLFVLDFDGDVQASRVEQLRREISALLTVASADDEVLLRLESPGGLVHSYGLAASQLARIRSRGLKLTVAVDRVAASGGYMMAAVAEQIIAAPFAVVGSIGVVAQVPNVHRLLKKNDVDVEVLTAGKYKRTLTVLGENTDEGREKFQEELELTHGLFQDHIVQYRPELELADIATGEAWYGTRALELKLIDTIQTSDDYVVAACADRDVYQLRWKVEKRPLERLLEGAQGLVERSLRGLIG